MNEEGRFVRRLKEEISESAKLVGGDSADRIEVSVYERSDRKRVLAIAFEVERRALGPALHVPVLGAYGVIGHPGPYAASDPSLICVELISHEPEIPWKIS